MDLVKTYISRLMETFMIVILIAAQIAALVIAMMDLGMFSQYSLYVYCSFQLLSVLVVLHILNKKIPLTFKFSWVIFVLIFPACGIILYFTWNCTLLSKIQSVKYNEIQEQNKMLTKQDSKVTDELTDLDILKEIDLIHHLSHYSIYKNTRTKYFEFGEDFFAQLLEELTKAKKFIFIESSIIAEGKVYTAIRDILIQKANDNVEIRILYDNDKINFKEENIRCASINPLHGSLFAGKKNRDHRKLIVIDGNAAFTGAINIDDRCITESQKYGHWKDMGIMLRGDAVWSFTVMFLDMWDYTNSESSEYAKYKPTMNYWEAKGFVAPFEDGPHNGMNPAKHIYMRIISSAKRYIYITTPYFTMDSDLSTALCTAARSGVDVRIMTPHRTVKPFTHTMTRSFYNELLQEGVRIFEYTPGFIHGNVMISDDKVCVIGTINFNFKSFFYNFECGVYVYNDPTVIDAKEDFLQTMDLSEEIPLQQHNIFVKAYYALLRMLSTLQ